MARPKIRFYFTFLLISVLTLAAAELGARAYLYFGLQKAFHPKHRFDAYRLYGLKPGFTEGRRGKNWIEINEQGFRRSTPVSKEKPAGTFRVFLLGGSAAQGMDSMPPFPKRHIYNHETIDSNLEKLFRQKYPDKRVEVINAAVSGYQVYQHTSYLLAEILNYTPDFIIFLDGHNDHYTYNPDYDYYLHNPYQFWTDPLQNPSWEGLLNYFSLLMAQHSAFFRLFYEWRLLQSTAKLAKTHNKTILTSSKDDFINLHRKAAKKQFLRNVHVNLSLLKQEGIGALLALQAELYFRDTRMLSDQEKTFLPLLSGDWWRKDLYPIVVDELKTTAEAYRAGFIDLNPGFNEEKLKGRQLFIDYCHLSPEGAEAAAQLLFPHVEKFLLTA